MPTSKLHDPLERLLPDGQVVDRNWLEKKGFRRPLVDYYLRSGALEAVARGAYRRPGPPLKWEHVVYSMQELGLGVYVGGRSALELQGMAHYLPLQGIKQIGLYGVGKLPGWVPKLRVPYKFELHHPRLLARLPEGALTTKLFGHWDWPIRYATPELALLEVLAEVMSAGDIELADKFFEAATVLRPELLRALLLACTHVKAKRLFLWLAARHNYPWSSVLDTKGVDLGSGKRVIVKGGVLNKQFQITVPRAMGDGPEQSVF
jgi:hypothetical protein